MHEGQGSETSVVFSVHGPPSKVGGALCLSWPLCGGLVRSLQVPSRGLCTLHSTFSEVTMPSHIDTENVVDNKPYC